MTMKKSKTLAAVAVVLLAFLVFTAPVGATEVEVSDVAGLTAALTNANANDIIKLTADINGDVKITTVKSIIIDGNGHTFTGNLTLGDAENKNVVPQNSITVKNIKFSSGYLWIWGYHTVTVQDNTFNGGVGPIAESNLDKPQYGVLSVFYSKTGSSTGGKVTVKNNIICNTQGYDSAGITVCQFYDAEVTGNFIDNTAGNSLTLTQGMGGTATITGNTLKNWGREKDLEDVLSGRALRLRFEVSDGSVIFTDNVMVNTNAPEEFVKIDASSSKTITSIDISNNYWNGVNPNNANYEGNGVESKSPYSYYSVNNLASGSTIGNIQYYTTIEASIGENQYCTLAKAVEAAKDGDTITLLNDVKLTKSLVLGTEGTITIDGTGHTITQAEGYTDMQNGLIMLGATAYGDDMVAKHQYTIKNVVFDGINGWSVIRSQGVTLTMDGCEIKNCEQTGGQALLRLDYTGATIQNTVIHDNSALMAIAHNFNGDSSQTKLTVDNCVIEDNTFGKIAAIYYVCGGGCDIKASEFIDNVVNCNTNGAVIYLGFQEDCSVTGNLFKDNKVTDSSASTRVGGAIFFGYEADVSGNAFVGNSATNANVDALGQDVCVSTYYTDIDLSDNYFDGEEPVEGEEYFIQHKDSGYKLVMNSYYTAYELGADGNVVLSNKVAGKDYDSGVTANVEKVGFDSVKVGYTQPEAKTVTVTNAGDAAVIITASTASGNYEVKVTKEAAVSAAPATLTIQPKAGLAVGNYEDTLTITIAETGKTITVPVSFLVYQPSSGGSSKPVEEPEEPVEPETPEEPSAGEVTTETAVSNGGEVAFETPAVPETPAAPEAGEPEAGTPSDKPAEPVVTGVVLPEGTDSKVTFIPVSEKPAPAGKEKQTKKVFEINVPTYEKGKPATVKFTMTVAELAKDGKTAADVALWHQDEETGEWTKLVISYTIIDGVVYFEAITHDFSPFAIVYEDTPVEEPTEEPTEEPASPAPIFAVLAGLGAAVVLRRK